jgi:hypothetical protein
MESMNVSFYGNISADVTKDIESGRLSFIIQVGFTCNHMYPKVGGRDKRIFDIHKDAT